MLHRRVVYDLQKRRSQLWLMNSEKLRLSNSCRSSSVVEQLIADQKVIGSNPMIDFMRAVSCTYHRFGMHI